MNKLKELLAAAHKYEDQITDGDGYERSVIEHLANTAVDAMPDLQLLLSRYEKLVALRDEAFKITDGHWHAHGGTNGCEVCDFHYKLIQDRDIEGE